VNTAQSLGYWLAVGLVLCGFCFILVRKLQAGGYSPPMALGLGLTAMVQPGNLETGALRTILFSATTFAVAWAAAALVQRQEPRRIVLLGSSLAGAQLLHPLCGAAATLILPFAVRKSLSNAGIRHGTGLYISLLFIPLLALAYWSIAQPELSALRDLPAKLPGPFPWLALAPIVAAVPIALAAVRIRNAVPLPVVAVIAAVTGMGALGTLLSIQRPNVTSAVLSVLSVFVASCWEDSPRRERNALLLIAANLVLSWSLAPYIGGPNA
jgi:hypothetical protein